MRKEIYTFLATKDMNGIVSRNRLPYRVPPSWSKLLPLGYEGKVKISREGKLLEYQRKNKNE